MEAEQLEIGDRVVESKPDVVRGELFARNSGVGESVEDEEVDVWCASEFAGERQALRRLLVASC